MSNLPQIHDWFYNLLTGGQWFFLYIALGLIIWGLMIWLSVKEKDSTAVGAGFALGLIIPPIIFGVLLIIGNFISFMIWLWFGGVGG